MDSAFAFNSRPIRMRTTWTRRVGFAVFVAGGLYFSIAPLLRATVGDRSHTSSACRSSDSESFESSSAREDSPEKRTLAPSRANGLIHASFHSNVDDGGLVLAGTVLGKNRRAAVVCGRLYREGDTILARGRTYRLKHVADDRIEVSPEGSTSPARRIVIRIRPGDEGSDAPGRAVRERPPVVVPPANAERSKTVRGLRQSCS